MSGSAFLFALAGSSASLCWSAVGFFQSWLALRVLSWPGAAGDGLELLRQACVSGSPWLRLPLVAGSGLCRSTGQRWLASPDPPGSRRWLRLPLVAGSGLCGPLPQIWHLYPSPGLSERLDYSQQALVYMEVRTGHGQATGTFPSLQAWFQGCSARLQD